MNKKAILLLAFVVSSAGLCIADELVSVPEAVEAEEVFKAPVVDDTEKEMTEEVAE